MSAVTLAVGLVQAIGPAGEERTASEHGMSRAAAAETGMLLEEDLVVRADTTVRARVQVVVAVPPQGLEAAASAVVVEEEGASEVVVAVADERHGSCKEFKGAGK